ncbi:MAG: abortive infection family protein [Rhodobacterales bacterium]
MIQAIEEIHDSLFEQALMMQNMITARATGGGMDDNIYRTIRSEFIADIVIKPLLPECVRTCRDGAGIWSYLKRVHSGSGAFEIRRQHINQAFAPLLEYLEEGNSTPSDANVSDVLSKYDGEGVQSAWAKALNRRSSDPQGAITSARTLLEEVCKHILEENSKQNLEKWDLPRLYSETSKLLNLAPSQYTEEVFKRILGGCQTVVENLGGLRNKIGDAHAQGRKPVKPAPRHAALAVNLAGSMSLFLIETWLEQNGDDIQQ